MDIGKKMAQRWVTDMPLFHCGRSYGSSISKRDFCSTNSSVVLHLGFKRQRTCRDTCIQHNELMEPVTG